MLTGQVHIRSTSCYSLLHGTDGSWRAGGITHTVTPMMCVLGLGSSDAGRFPGEGGLTSMEVEAV